MSEVLKMANDLGEKIKLSDEFLNYQNAKTEHDNDAELQTMVGEFNLKKMSVMQEMKNEPRNEEKIQKLQEEMRSVYAEIMKNNVMIEYMQAKEDIEKLVNDIYSVINFYVTGKEQSCDPSQCESCGGGCHQ